MAVKQQPGRLFGFGGSVDDPLDPHNTRALGGVALANLRPGDRLPVRPSSVVAIDDRSLTIACPFGRHRIGAIGEPADRLILWAEGVIVAAHHGVDPGDLVRALERDQAFRLVDGCMALVEKARAP